MNENEFLLIFVKDPERYIHSTKAIALDTLRKSFESIDNEFLDEFYDFIKMICNKNLNNFQSNFNEFLMKFFNSDEAFVAEQSMSQFHKSDANGNKISLANLYHKGKLKERHGPLFSLLLGK